MLTWGSWTGWRRRARRALTHLVVGLCLVGGMHSALTAGMLADGQEAGGTAPDGMAAHPERLAGHVPPSAEEAALWRDLGWHPRTAI